MKLSSLLKRVHPATALSLVLLLLPLSGSAADQPEAGDSSKGARVWVENCGRCHNIRDPRELRDDQWVTSIFHMRVRAGLTGQEARDALAFLTASNKPHRDRIITEHVSNGVAAIDAQAVYDRTCAACHGADGKGTVPGAPDFTLSKGRLSKPDDVLIDSMTYGFQGPGSPMAMPAKGGNTDLTSSDIQALLDYLRKEFGS